ncbi:hypothetical protein K1X76_07050 [bacterium]|nr:hypothetical protein [bacterium]
MAETIDEININWSDEAGNLLVKELKKEILTRGSWTTIMFLYQDFDKKKNDFGPKKIRIGRYQKRNGKFMQQSKFNISSAKQAKQFMGVINGWLPEMGDGAEGDDE